MRRDLRALPKAELHLHLVGALRAATYAELAPTAADPRAFSTFDEFQAVFRAAFAAVASRADDLQRLVREVVADAARDGVVWVLPHIDPAVFPALGPPEEVLALVLDAGRAAGASCGVGFGVTIAAMRHRGPAAAEALAAFAAGHAGEGVVAFGLTGDEERLPSGPFARAFAIAADAGLTAAPHAGELSGAASVRSAISDLGATRIAHGIRAVEDPRLVELIVDRGVTLDVCVSSNVALGVVSMIDRHPLPELLAAGVRCSLGADDPLMFGAGLLDEYELARGVLGLDDEQLAAIARTSIESSGAPVDLAIAALNGIEAWLR